MLRYRRWFGIALVWAAVDVSEGLQAAAPGVPVLGTTPDNFVSYAETSLPRQYLRAAIQASDNTPLDNPISNAGAELGRVLFYDPRLSHNNSTSCASCHRQENGFSDPEQLSTGFAGEQTERHSMGLTNARFYESGRFFWDERAATLEDQVLQPIQSPVEMGMELDDLVVKLGQTEYYPVLFQRAFGDGQVTTDRISKALSQFVRSMVSYNSKYDQAFAEPGPPDFAGVFTASEERGHNTFGASCAGCHATDAHRSDETHNIGLDLVSSEALGTDEGAGGGEFKAPSLRNIAVRGTYMHDGRFESLEEVIGFYSTGIRNNPNLDPRLRTPNGQPVRFNFDAQETADLVAFLSTLTDDHFLTASMFSDPFVTLSGDYNGDGAVNDEDYLVWRSGYGGSDLDADGNGDGAIDSADYAIWRANLGRTWLDLTLAQSGAASLSPEPAAAVLLASGGLVLVGRRSNRVRR